jgi:hypothetical protein
MKLYYLFFVVIFYNFKNDGLALKNKLNKVNPQRSLQINNNISNEENEDGSIFIDKKFNSRSKFFNELLIDHDRPLSYVDLLSQFQFTYDDGPVNNFFIDCSNGFKGRMIGNDWNPYNCRWNYDSHIIYNNLTLDQINNGFLLVDKFDPGEIKNNCNNEVLVHAFKVFFSNISTPMFVFAVLLFLYSVRNFYLRVKSTMEKLKIIMELYGDFFDQEEDKLKLFKKERKCFKKTYINEILNTIHQPKIITLLFSRYFFLTGKSDKEIKLLSKIDDKYKTLNKSFLFSNGPFFSYYLYTLIGILGALPLTVTSLIFNIDLLEKEYSFETLLFILMTFCNLLFIIMTPCFLKTFDNNPGVILIEFWWAFIRFCLFTLFRFVY